MGSDELGRLRGVNWTARLSPATHVGIVVLLLGASWIAVYASGGTRTAWPHVFYFPIVLAAVALGLRSAVVVGVAATVLCGPLMPLDTGIGLAQSLDDWLARGGFFVAIGVFSGATIRSLRATLRRSVDAHLQREFEAATGPVATPSSDEAARIQRTLAHRRFRPVYQPIYALSGGRLLAVEALTRFDGPPEQPPDVWFEQAARLGMETELDLAATRVALEGAEQLLPDEVALHINTTPATLRDTRLLELLTSYPHRRIVIELTEHAVIHDYVRLESPCWRLRDHGIKIAVDDTGAGISSLRHVVKLAPEVIKLDKSLTHNVHNDPIQHALANALVRFSDEIGTLLVVEGIEHQTDLTTWTRLAAQAGQGYHLARPGPLPAEQRCHLITRRRIPLLRTELTANSHLTPHQDARED